MQSSPGVKQTSYLVLGGKVLASAGADVHIVKIAARVARVLWGDLVCGRVISMLILLRSSAI